MEIDDDDFTCEECGHDFADCKCPNQDMNAPFFEGDNNG